MRVNIGSILCSFQDPFYGRDIFLLQNIVISFAKCGSSTSSLNFTHYFLESHRCVIGGGELGNVDITGKQCT